MDANIRNKEFYKGKRVFITGDTGYKGAWLSAVLSELGANATGCALLALTVATPIYLSFVCK